MRTITKLREDIAILVKQLGDMRAKCISEKRDPSDEEREQGQGYLAEIKKLENLVAYEVQTQETLDRAKEPEPDPDRTPIDTRKDVKEQEKRDSFASHGEFYHAVMMAAKPGHPVDPRLSTRA